MIYFLQPSWFGRCVAGALAVLYLGIQTAMNYHLPDPSREDPMHLGMRDGESKQVTALRLRATAEGQRLNGIRNNASAIAVDADPSPLVADMGETLKAMATFERWRLVDARNGTRRECADDQTFPYMHFSKAHEAYLLRMLARGVPFAWIRMGDGEFNCLRRAGSGSPEQRCSVEIHDLYVNFAREIGTLPANFFVNPGHWWLCKPGYKDVRRTLLDAAGAGGFYFLDSFYLATDGNETDGEHFASYIRDGPVFFVGGGHFRGLSPNLFPNFHMIEVPAHSTVEDLYEVEQRFRDAERQHGGEVRNMKVLVSMGLTTKIFIHHMAREFPRHTFIDTGASMDHFVGRKSRDYNQKTSKFCVRFPHWMKDGLC